jgi:hypothetical protein
MMHFLAAHSNQRKTFKIALALIFLAAPCRAQSLPPASAARILLLPRRIVSGDRATLAVLDVNGRLTPGATINFSNGDHYTTDATGRARFVAPLNVGVVYATLPGRAGRVATTVLSAAEAASTALQVSAAPRVASITDRFELSGTGFCGDADANRVSIAGQSALVLAASPISLIVLPPQDLTPGRISVQIACGKQSAAAFSVTLVSLELEASSAPLAPGEHRALAVHVRGTASKVTLEARNLAPDVAEIVTGLRTGVAAGSAAGREAGTTAGNAARVAGGSAERNATGVAAGNAMGTAARVASTGGAENIARFEIVGKKRGNFLISIRLISYPAPPRP